MNHKTLSEFLDQLKAKPKLMQKIKIIAVVGIGGFLVTGALMIWAGISALNYVASSVTQTIQSPRAQAHVENLKIELNGLPKLQVVNCWGKAQALLAIQPWLERPALANLENLKVACIKQDSSPCQGAQCKKMNELIHTAEGSYI